MTSGRRLLILSCSKCKRPDTGRLPALERYDGPAFCVLRRYLRQCPGEAAQLDVYILSAAYGLIPSSHPIVDYNRIMTPERAAELHDEVMDQFQHLLSFDYKSLCLAMSKVYLRALDGWPALVPRQMSVALTTGPQGVKLAQLKRWLWGEAYDEAAGKREPSPRGVARIRGLGVRMTPEQVFGVARAALAGGQGEPNSYHSWYVQVDDRRVAPKWLVSQLTGLPVSAFVTSEARRLLTQLGIKVVRA